MKVGAVAEFIRQYTWNMALGYRGNPSWRDMSEYVVHFTKDRSEVNAYSAMMSILAQRQLVPGGRFGIAKGINLGLAPGQESVCFSEIPLDRLDRLVDRWSRFGIGFRQEFIAAAGGGRVWYVDRGTEIAHWISALMHGPPGAGRPPPDAPIWHLTPFIDFPGTYGETQYRFEWEREWRLPGNLRFTEADVEFLFIPEESHVVARGFFRDVRQQNLGPAYECPFIDPLWPEADIQLALSAL